MRFPFFLRTPRYYKAIFPRLCQSIVPNKLSEIAFPWYQARGYTVQGKFNNSRLILEVIFWILLRIGD
jgi:hypothetical protein